MSGNYGVTQYPGGGAEQGVLGVAPRMGFQVDPEGRPDLGSLGQPYPGVAGGVWLATAGGGGVIATGPAGRKGVAAGSGAYNAPAGGIPILSCPVFKWSLGELYDVEFQIGQLGAPAISLVDVTINSGSPQTLVANYDLTTAVLRRIRTRATGNVAGESQFNIVSTAAGTVNPILYSLAVKRVQS